MIKMDRTVSPLEDELDDRYSPELFHDLIKRGDKSGVKAFLAEAGASVKTRFYLRNIGIKTFPLHLAVDVKPANYHSDLVKYFISEGADYNTLNRGGCAPLHYAALHQNIAAAVDLLEAGADVNIRSRVMGSYRWGYMPGTSYSFPLHMALGREYSERSGGHVRENTTLIELINLFRSYGADCNLFDDFGPTPLHYAVMLNDVSLVCLFLDAGANVNRSVRKEEVAELNMPYLLVEYIPPIFRATEVSMLKFLMSRKADIETLTKNGRNILHYSISCERNEVTRFLVPEMPVLIHAKDYMNMAPLTVLIDGMTELVIDGIAELVLYEEEKLNEYGDILHLLMIAGCDPSTEVFKAKNWVKLESYFTTTPRGEELLKIMKKISSHPRSLSNLCTFKIRSVLQRNVSSAVDSLPLPTNLKQLVTLEQFPG